MVNNQASVNDIPDEILVRRAVAHAIRAGGKKRPAWRKVMDAFGLGSTFASQLCRRCEFDPDTGERLGPESNAAFRGRSEGDK